MKALQNAKKVGTFAIITCGIAIIYELPYLRNSFYIPMCQTFNLTNQEFGMLSSIYSIVCMFAYFIGGIYSDRIFSRWLLFLPFLGTGCVGFWFSTFPSYASLQVIYALLGITTVFTFFSSAIRMLQDLGDSDEQGRIFGFMEGGKGIVVGIASLVMVVLFESLGGGKFGFTWVIRIYAILNVIIGLGIILLLPDDKKTFQNNVPIFTQIKTVLSIPSIWIMSIIVFTAYSVYAIMSFIPPYMVKFYGISVETSTQIGAFRNIIQILGAFTGGFLADKIRSSTKVILWNFFTIIFGLTVFLMLPRKPSLFFLCILNFVFLAVTIYAIKGLYYAIIDEGKIDRSMTGSVSGVIACVGYFPDVFIYTMIGSWIDKGIEGYNLMLKYGILMCLIGAATSVILLKLVKTKENFS